MRKGFLLEVCMLLARHTGKNRCSNWNHGSSFSVLALQGGILWTSSCRHMQGGKTTCTLNRSLKQLVPLPGGFKPQADPARRDHGSLGRSKYEKVQYGATNGDCEGHSFLFIMTSRNSSRRIVLSMSMTVELRRIPLQSYSSNAPKLLRSPKSSIFPIIII